MTLIIRSSDEIPAACLNVEPSIFDDPLLFIDALAMCSSCQRRTDCLEQVDPARSYFDGVAGGIPWHNGHPITISGHDWPIEGRDYLTTRPHAEPKLPPVSWKHLAPPIDDLKVQRFLKGLTTYDQLTMVERLDAACRLRELGFSPQEACRQTHVAASALASAWRSRAR